ncbi:hypothetical protein ScPMuIL_014530 [Solemya velum]
MPDSSLGGNILDQESRVALLGVPIRHGQARSGTDLGPNTLRDGGLKEKLSSVGCDVVDYGNLVFRQAQNDNSHERTHNSRSVGAAAKQIADAVSRRVLNGEACLALGGDHSMAIGTIYGHAQVRSDIAVIWVDAHADINTPLTSESGNIHGMPLSFLVRELEPYVPKLPGMEWIKPCISAKDIAYIGLRDVDPAERWIIEKFNMTAFSMQEVDKYGIHEVMDRAMKAVDPNGTRSIHLSFDVDGLDPSLTPSTGTPVPGGLSLREGLYIAEEVCATGRLAVMDVAEVNPLLGNDEDSKRTLEITMDVIERCFGKKRQGVCPPDYLVPLPSDMGK